MSTPSKVALAKAEQNFQMKPAHPRCADCQHFTMDREQIPWSPYSSNTWTRESNLRCSLGGFKVGKTSVCRKFERKEAA